MNELLDMGLIGPNDSEWAHPMLYVTKEDGSITLYIDFRSFNTFTVPDIYPMRIARDMLFDVGQLTFITVIDFTKGYW